MRVVDVCVHVLVYVHRCVCVCVCVCMYVCRLLPECHNLVMFDDAVVRRRR